ncbi:hypothetical protein BDA99DRAFT_491964 [Phascolomyces articulosus]|uniref:HECT-type E3 ubiquitin transferase n=1 Tax=Phascolomyces articulosus TaxID=60185 RepID=A0AAD5KQX4_9FUNG|nr:hypothetical protein BDA99DRAFT_491964 [Phascolomyces articulosus]
MSTILDRSHRMYDPTSPMTSPTTHSGSSHQSSNATSSSHTTTNSTNNTTNNSNSNNSSPTTTLTNTATSTTTSTTSTTLTNNNNNDNSVWNDTSSMDSNPENSTTASFEETNTSNNKRLLSKLNGKSSVNNKMACHHYSTHARPSPPQQQPSQQSLSSLSNHGPTKDRSHHTITTIKTMHGDSSSSSSSSSSKNITHLPETKSKSLRKRRLKEAKYDYEARIEQYFQQLTVGCGRYDCTNRFCATGKGGISNLHRQAALVMSIQLASKPESRLCQHYRKKHSSNHHHHTTPYETTKTHPLWKTEEDEDDVEEDEEEEQVRRVTENDPDQKQYQSPTRAKPFLQSLFSSSSFLSLFGMQVENQETNSSSSHSSSTNTTSTTTQSQDISTKNARRRRRSKRENGDLPNRSNQVSSNKDELMGSVSCNNALTYQETHLTPPPSEEQPSTSSHTQRAIEEEEDIDNSYYYQLDSMSDDTSSINQSSYESDTSSEEGMLLAIRPNIITHLKSGIEQLDQLTDQQKMYHWCRAVFQNWEGIGNSFLSHHSEDEEDPPPLQVLEGLSFPKIQLDDLSQLYNKLLHLLDNKNNDNNKIHSRRISETVTESLETLLDRMYMNADEMTSLATVQDTGCLRTIVEWCRSLMAVLEWIRVQQQEQQKEHDGQNQQEDSDLDPKTSSNYQKITTPSPLTSSSITGDMWSGILSHKFIQVVNKIASHRQSLIRQVLKQHFASLDAARLRSLVKHLHDYLINHFHTGPYKHGEQDSVVMATKFLELAYEANALPSTQSIIPASDFNCEAVCKKLNIKNEYRIWRRVLQYGEGRHSISTIAASSSSSRPTTSSSSSNQFYGLNEQQRRTRLFLTTTSTSILLPYPFANEYQFSWFSYPFLLPPPVKRKILQLDAMSQMSAEYEDACVNHTLVVHARRLLSDAPRMVRNLETNLKSATCPYLLLEIRREHFVEDTFHQVSRQWVNIKKPLKIKFVGGGEEGMDQGGVQKEFFNVLFEKLMATSMGLFDMDLETRLQWMFPVVRSEESLRTYEMVGVMMGLAIYNGVIMNLQFPHVLWKVLVQPHESKIDGMAERHELFTFQDLCEGWPSLAHGLQQLLDWQDEVQDVFCRNYEISLDVFGQGIVTWPLKPEGSDIPVTNANRQEFVRDYCTHFLYYAQREPLLAIRRGLWSVMGGSAMDLCTAQVLEVVACGQRQSADLDLEELERVTEYDDGYHAEHRIIRDFWTVVHQDMTSEQKRKLLFFVTASDRVPVGGLKELTFVVQRNGPDSDRLPTALTCFSRLLLPEYTTREKLSERLITAIENAKGFGLV